MIRRLVDWWQGPDRVIAELIAANYPRYCRNADGTWMDRAVPEKMQIARPRLLSYEKTPVERGDTIRERRASGG